MSPLTLVAVRLVFGTLGLLVFVPFRPTIMEGWYRRLRRFFVVADNQMIDEFQIKQLRGFNQLGGNRYIFRAWLNCP
jgi:hypothetical protein